MTIRLPSSHAAIIAPLITSDRVFPGVHIGRSVLDGRPFSLSPVMVDSRVLPSTNSFTVGGLGSGKSGTKKAQSYREYLRNGHQYVVIDSFGEDANSGEWALMTKHMNGLVIKAGEFTINPVSPLFPADVREQLMRSLVLAVEPDALSPTATHALQHALNNPKATSLNGVVDALISPEEGRHWSAGQLTEWGVSVALALSRYTEGSLRGLFDGPDAGLPPTDLPMISFDFSQLDRNSPAIPALMAAVCCWVEHIWLRQSTAVHRHLVLEEAWQILSSPATVELIQRLLKNSRKAAFSLEVIMHTLSDQGDGKARDVARLCEVITVGRLPPEEAAQVGAVLDLPQWAIDEIPSLEPGQAVWKIGPGHVDIIQTVLTEEEVPLTDTSVKRRAAQQGLYEEHEEAALEMEEYGEEEVLEEEHGQEAGGAVPDHADYDDYSDDTEWDWDMAPGVIDARHHTVLQAAEAGRYAEAAELAAIGEREDITTYGINSDQAMSWMATRAQVAELGGRVDQAAQLRATVTRMGYDGHDTTGATDDQYGTPLPETPIGDGSRKPPSTKRRRYWFLALVAALGVSIAAVEMHGADDRHDQETAAKQAAYKGHSAVRLDIDGVKTDTWAQWSKDGKSVVLSAWFGYEEKPQMVRIDSGERTAQKEAKPLKEGEYSALIRVELEVPVKDRYQRVQMRVTVGGPTWKAGTRAPHRVIEFGPDRTATDTENGQPLKQL